MIRHKKKMKEVWEQVVNFSVTAAKFLIFVCLFFCLILCLSQCTLQVRSTQVVLQNLFFFFILRERFYFSSFYVNRQRNVFCSNGLSSAPYIVSNMTTLFWVGKLLLQEGLMPRIWSAVVEQHLAIG